MQGPALPFTKMHGCGNDYVVVGPDQPIEADPADLARALCDRRRGVGADGLLLVRDSQSADLRMCMYNPDGSEAEMCGNGIRCVAAFAAARSLVPDPHRMRIETRVGVLQLVRTKALWTVDMGRPRPGAAETTGYHPDPRKPLP